jgi:hypothetical protein
MPRFDAADREVGTPFIERMSSARFAISGAPPIRLS